MFGLLFGGDPADLGVELGAGGGEDGDLSGEKRNHEASRAKGVEGVDLGLFVGARVASG